MPIRDDRTLDEISHAASDSEVNPRANMRFWIEFLMAEVRQIVLRSSGKTAERSSDDDSSVAEQQD